MDPKVNPTRLWFLVSLTAFVTLVLVVCLLLLPSYVKLLRDLEIQVLPLPTELMLNLVVIVQSFWWTVIAVSFCVLILGWIGKLDRMLPALLTMNVAGMIVFALSAWLFVVRPAFEVQSQLR